MWVSIQLPIKGVFILTSYNPVYKVVVSIQLPIKGVFIPLVVSLGIGIESQFQSNSLLREYLYLKVKWQYILDKVSIQLPIKGVFILYPIPPISPGNVKVSIQLPIKGVFIRKKKDRRKCHLFSFNPTPY